MQYKTVTVSKDKKTDKEKVVSEKEEPKKPFKQESISKKEFNDDKTSKTKAALLAAKAEALQSSQKSKDATSVNKVNYSKEEAYPDAKFTYKNEEYTPKDSSDYKAGYKDGIKKISKNTTGIEAPFGNKLKIGQWSWRGWNASDAYSSGYSEGKDAVLIRREEKKKANNR